MKLSISGQYPENGNKNNNNYQTEKNWVKLSLSGQYPVNGNKNQHVLYLELTIIVNCQFAFNLLLSLI